MKLFDEILREHFVFLLQTDQIRPLVRIEEVHQIEKFSDVVVQRCLVNS